jgi:hypothetical protein
VISDGLLVAQFTFVALNERMNVSGWSTGVVQLHFRNYAIGNSQEVHREDTDGLHRFVFHRNDIKRPMPIGRGQRLPRVLANSPHTTVGRRKFHSGYGEQFDSYTGMIIPAFSRHPNRLSLG